MSSRRLTVAEVAKLKGCAERTVRRACDAKELRAERVTARLWLISPKSVEHWTPRERAGRPPKTE